MLDETYSIDSYCNSEELSMQQVAPDLMKKNIEIQELMKKNFNKFKELGSAYTVHNHVYQYFRQSPNMISSFMHMASNHRAYRDFCISQKMDQFDPDTCAIIISTARNH